MWEIFASFSTAFIRISLCFVQKWEGGNPSWPDQPAGCVCRDSTTRGDSVTKCPCQWGYTCVGVQTTANDGREDRSVWQIMTKTLNRVKLIATVLPNCPSQYKLMHCFTHWTTLELVFSWREKILGPVPVCFQSQQTPANLVCRRNWTECFENEPVAIYRKFK